MTAPSPVQETFRIAAIVPSTRRDDVPRPSLLEPSPSQTSQQSVPSMSVSTDQEAVNTSNTVQPQQVQQETTARQLSTSLPNPVVPTLGRRKSKQFAVSTQWEREMAQGTLPKDIHSYFCCCATRIGNMSALLTYSDGTPLLIAGPCWPFCVFVTLPVLLGVPVVVIYFIFIGQTQSNLPDWVMAIYIPAVVFTLIALCCVSCRNPGLMERVTDEEAGDGGWFWNEQVGSFRPPGALYCRECGVLIQGYDHLCPWTGTGIGRDNMVAFKVFVVSVNVLCYLTIAMVVWALLDGLAGN